MFLLIPDLCFLMFILIIDGEPFRFALLRRLALFSDLDFIQNCILNIYVGGLVLYLIAVLPFRFFSFPVLVAFTLACLFLSIRFHAGTLRRIAKSDGLKSSILANKRKLLEAGIVFALFLVLLVVQLSSLSNLVFGGIFDESIHSLKVQVILENNYVPLTLEPYLPEGIVYPQASHVILAFSYHMLNFNVPKVVYLVTILFKSLSVFGAYFLGRKLDSSWKYSLSLAFVFTFVSSWPLYVVWGSNPFLLGFPLFLVNLGLFFALIRNDAKNSLAELAVVGLLIGFDGAIIVSFYQTLTVVALLVLVYWLVQKRNLVGRKLYEFSILLLFSLIPLSPVFYRFFAFYPYPGHNVGLPSDFVGYQSTRLSFTMTQALQWAFENLSPHFLIRVLTLFLITGLGILLWKTRGYKDAKAVIAFALTFFLSATLLSIASFFLPADVEVIGWGHQGILIAVSMNVLIAAFYVRLAQICRRIRLDRVSRFFTRNSYWGTLLAIMVLTSINIPFCYYRLSRDPQVLPDMYQMFAVTTADDYDLMTWMKGNISSDAVVLVSPNEPGLFIPAISQYKIAFPYSGSAFARSYQRLVNLTRMNILNETTYSLMQNLSITHVYVGYDAAYWWFHRPKWNPLLFLGNPNFGVVKNFAGAYLFQLNNTNPHEVFLDDFEHKRWDDYGWQIYPYGCGLGNATITNSSRSGLGKCLRITSQAVYTVLEYKYASYMTRRMFVQNNSDIELSFYLNITTGFGGNDTFAVLVSNIYRNQSIVFSTPNGVYDRLSPRYRTVLDRHEGVSAFNLTSVWSQAFNCSVPSEFILEFANWDFDGVKNVAYVDDIKVTSKPLSGLPK